MTDDEINKRVAEIEGWEEIQVGRRRAWQHKETCQISYWLGAFPYATDWAWCGPLVEKYGLSLDFMGEPDDAPGAYQWQCTWGYKLGNFRQADTPQRAICLAVIAAHEGK